MRKLDPTDLFEVLDDGPDRSRDAGAPLVMVHALEGFFDAGHVVEVARTHLLASSESSVVARFDIDQLYDYRARRPLMRFERDHFASVDMPDLAVHALTDDNDTRFLLLAGPEPDVQWERFARAVELVVGALGVTMTVGLNAFPIGVPHTRPTHVVLHSADKELLKGYEPWMGSVLVPGAMNNLLELRLGRAGLPALGLAAAIPQYLAQTAYPAGAAALLRELMARVDLRLPMATLDEAATVARKDVDAQVAGSDDVQSVVRTLEESYDAAVEARASGLGLEADLPTADEIGAQFEQFLADQSRGDDAV